MEKSNKLKIFVLLSVLGGFIIGFVFATFLFYDGLKVRQILSWEYKINSSEWNKNGMEKWQNCIFYHYGYKDNYHTLKPILCINQTNE